MVMFADETALIKANKTPEELEINSFIAFNIDYCHSNDLAVNEKESN